jgi:hypothetical protein
MGENSQWTTIVSSAENRADFCAVLDGKPLFSALYGMYTVTLDEQKAVWKVNAQAGRSGAVHETSLESTDQDDFQEVRTRKRHISNDTSQTAKKSTKSVSISTAVEQTPKTVSTRNFFAPLRTNDMDTETTGAQNTLPGHRAPRKSGRQPPTVMTSTTHLIRLQSDLKEHVKGEYGFRNTRTVLVITTQRKIGMICSAKPVLTEDLCVVQEEEIFNNMLYVRNVHLTKGQAYSYETNPSSRQRGCYIRTIKVRVQLKKISGRGFQGA